MLTTLEKGNIVNDNTQPQMPTPNPALKRLDQFVGTWRLRGRFIGSDEDTITGEATYRWLPGGFFLEQHVTLDFTGMTIDSLELIGYDPQTDTFPSTVFANLAPTPLPYTWKVDSDDVTISVTHGPLDATFTGSFSADGNRFGGGWRPNPGADPNVNIAYDIEGLRQG